MRNSRILILGGSGQVGWELRHKLACLGKIFAVEFPEVDLCNVGSIRALVQKIKPTIIVNAAAYSAVDRAETEPELAAAINATAPGMLAEEAKRLHCVLVHYSTDYVFDGTKKGAWVETDAPHPINVYGRTKLAGDQAIQAVGGDYLIFRTSWVYGARGKNFLLTMLRLARERGELRIVDDQVGAPSTSECIAQATADVLAQVLAPEGVGINGRSGIYNLTNAGDTSWYGFAKTIFQKASTGFGLSTPCLVPITTGEYPCLAQRPANSRLSCQRLEETFGVMMPHWEYALSLVLDTLKEGTSQVSTNVQRHCDLTLLKNSD
jgi:dTDP-4-dehydrorhamnose reductase